MAQDDEVDKLKSQVNNLTQLVGYLSVAMDNISKNQEVMSDTVNNLVETEAQSLEIQKKLVVGVSSIQDMLHKLLPSHSNGE